VELAPDRRLRKVFATPALEVFLEQRNRPFDRLIAEVLRSSFQAGRQGRHEFFGPNGGSIPTALVCQTRRIMALAITRNPVIDAHPAGPKELCNIRDGSAGSRLQDCQGTPKDARIVCGPQLLLESPSLRGRQLQTAHGRPPFLKATASNGECKVSIGNPLRRRLATRG
jgi:hypothetical protein